MKSLLTTIILSVIMPALILGQNQTFDSLFDLGYTVSVRGHAGFLISHRENMSHLVTGHVGGFEINLDRQSSGSQAWHDSFNRPFVGVGLLHVSLGNPAQLGSATAVFGYVDFPLMKREKFIFHYKWSGGLGFVSKPFDRVDNYKNTAIGSVLNMTASLLLETRYRVGERMWFTSGLGFNHWSNSAIAVPNLGINVPTFTLGIQGYFGDLSLHLEKEAVTDLPRDIEFIVFGAPGIREIHPVEGKLYGVVHAFAEAVRRMDNKRKVGIGLDLFYDASDLEINNRDTSNVFLDNGSEFVKVGIHMSHELVFGRFSAVAQMGVYLRNNFELDGPMYHRMSYRYYVSDWLFIDGGFKSHWAVAENFEVGIGYKFE